MDSKDWTETESTKRPVTNADRKARAKNIASILGDPKRWHSHGRGIDIKVLESDEIKLKVKNFGDDPELNEKIRLYYSLFIDYCKKVGAYASEQTVFHSKQGIRRI